MEQLHRCTGHFKNKSCFESGSEVYSYWLTYQLTESIIKIYYFLKAKCCISINLLLLGSGIEITGAFQVELVVKNLPANTGRHKTQRFLSGRSKLLWGGHNNLLQYSFLENPVDREAWQATVHRVTTSQIWRKQLSTLQHRNYGFFLLFIADMFISLSTSHNMKLFSFILWLRLSSIFAT